jgi:hypothetical protein
MKNVAGFRLKALAAKNIKTKASVIFVIFHLQK